MGTSYTCWHQTGVLILLIRNALQFFGTEQPKSDAPQFHIIIDDLCFIFVMFFNMCKVGDQSLSSALLIFNPTFINSAKNFKCPSRWLMLHESTEFSNCKHRVTNLTMHLAKMVGISLWLRLTLTSANHLSAKWKLRFNQPFVTKTGKQHVGLSLGRCQCFLCSKPL